MESDHIHLKINMNSMFILGAFKLNFKNPLANFLYNYVYSKFVIGYLICFVVTQYVEMYNTLDQGLSNAVSILGVSLLYTDTICKTFVCSGTKVYKLVKQIRNTEIKVLNYNNKHIKEMYYQYIKWNYLANKLLAWAGAFAVLPFFVSLMILQNAEDCQIEKHKLLNVTDHIPRPLPFNSWFPFNRYRFYYVSYLCHILAGTIGCSLTVTDIFFVSLMNFAIGQIKILQYSFRNTKFLAENLAKRHPGMTKDEAVRICVQHFITMHKVMIEYVWTLDSAMSLLMLFDFAIASLQMAIYMLGIQIVVSGFGWRQMCVLVYLFSMFVQLFLFYWNANELMLESSGVATAIWESDWMEYGQEIKKSLMFIMLRSQKPLTLSVGPFYEMSTQTALSILRATYSYVAILRQMYMRR